MAFIYDLSDTWNNAGISFSGIKINVTDSASAAGSKLLDLQIGSASKFTVGKTGTVIATGLIESTVGGFRFPDGTTQITKATVNSVSGTGTVNGITLTGTVTDSGSLTLGGTLGNIANSQLTNSAITINGTSTALGGSISVGTVTSVSGTGTVNGLTLTGTVTNSGSLTLGGTLGNIANSQLTNSAITINGTSTALGGSISVGTVTSVAALTLGTSGTDLASSVANGTTTPVITLNVPTASATNRGALSSSDWSTFNAKQAALVSGTNIKTVGGASLLGSGDVGTIGLAYGGTGATTASGARTALGLGTAAVLNAGVAGGVATLDGSGTVPTSQLPGAVLGGLNYQGTWNASTNTPTLASSTGSKGYYYVVSVAGSTNLNGITDWKIGDWAVYDGTTWQKVDNTDAVSSVNGFTGAVVLTTSDVAQGTNLYFTQAAARGSVSAGTGISYNSTSGVITNSAPDQTVALTGAGTTVVTGTYPNFTITSNDSTVGTVTSVAASGGTTGLSFTGSPITSSGTLTLGGTLALASGGTGATTASGARTALGLGTAATTDASAYATAAQGAKADTAVQTIASTDGSVTITGTTALDLSVAVAGSTSNVLLPVRNTTGATLTKGTAVYISGATGQLSTVSKAIATGDATSAQTLGLVTANIANNSNGNVTLIGTITNIDTSAYTDGQQLYLSPTTAGTLTGTKPYAPNHLVYMAVVESAHPSQGKLFVKVQNGYEMDELHDVSAQSPTNGQTLVYNSTTDLWEKNTVSLTAGVNGTLPVANGGTGTTTAFTTGSVVFAGASGAYSQDNANFFWDDTNNRLGIGTATPLSALDVIGNIRIPSTNSLYWAGGNELINAVENSRMTFFVAGSERMRINSSGNVGIGVTPSTWTDYTALQVGALGGAALAGTVNNTFLSSNAYYNSGFKYAATGAGATYYQQTSSEHRFFNAPSGTAGNAISFTQAMTLDASGNLGIGTSSPGNKLAVAGGQINTVADDAYAIALNATTGNVRVIPYAAAYTGSVLVSYSGGYAGYGPFTVDAANIRLWTNGNERMRVTSTGDVGIGTVSPGYKLQVNGTMAGVVASGANYSAIRTSDFYYMTVSADGLNTLTDANGSAPMLFKTGGSERARITSGGLFGIGTSSPNAVLAAQRATSAGNTAIDVINSAAANTSNKAIVRFSTSYDYIGYEDVAPYIGGYMENSSSLASGLVMGTYTGGSIAERLRIDPSGNVGINTTAALGKLQVASAGAGAAEVVASNTVGVERIHLISRNTAGNSYLQAQNSNCLVGTYDNYNMQFLTNNAERMRIDTSGNLMVGTTSALSKFTVQQGADGYDQGISLSRVGADRGTIFLNATGNTMNFGRGAATSMSINDSGNVGIGTSSPQRPLQVFYNSSNVGAYTAILQGATGGYGAGVSFQSQLTGGALAEMARITADGEAAWNTTASNQDAGLRFYTTLDGTVAEKMRLNSDGNLSITGSGNGTLTIGSSAGAYSSVLNMNSSAGGGSAITASQFLGVHTAGTERMRINAGGDLLVGTTGGAYSFSGRGLIEVSGTFDSLMAFKVNGTPRLYVQASTGGEAYIVAPSHALVLQTGAAVPIQFLTNNTEKMRLTSAGEVGIGTSSPISGYKLTMEGNGAYAALRCVTNAGFSTLSGFDGATQRWAIGQAGFGGNNGLGFYVGSGTEVGRFDASGNLMVGVTNAGVSNTTSLVLDKAGGYLIVNHSGTSSGAAYEYYAYNGTAIGSITQNGTTGVLFNTGSDGRLKENIADADDAASLIDAIQVRKFDWKADGSHQRYGFVAQELVTVAPEAVSQPEDPEEMMGVDYSKLVPMLVKEIQSLRARVAQLEGN